MNKSHLDILKVILEHVESTPFYKGIIPIKDFAGRLTYHFNNERDLHKAIDKLEQGGYIKAIGKPPERVQITEQGRNTVLDQNDF